MPTWEDERTEQQYVWENPILTVDYPDDGFILYGPRGEVIYTYRNPIGYQVSGS